MARTRGGRRPAEEPTPPTNSGSAGNPISIRDSNSPARAAPNAPLTSTGRAGSRSAKHLGPVIAGPSTKKANRIGKAAPKKREKQQPVKKECIICVTTRQVGNSAGRGFKTIEGTCEHFQSICNVCIGKMIKEKISKRDLDEAVLVCAFPDCEHVLDYNTIMQMIFKGARESLDTALLKHHICNSENYVACLNPKCEHYFSIEDCQGKSNKGKAGRGQKITCPYCKDNMCLACMRPWHGSTSCDKVKIAEEKKSLEAIEKISKPCPKCGANIEKNGGCNHMKCRRCHHDFCFSCLVAYGAYMQHAEGCADIQRNIMQDPRNWLPDGVNPGDGWPAAFVEPPRQLPQQAGHALPPRNVPQPVLADVPQQPGPPRGLFGLMNRMQLFAHDRLNLNGNPDVRQNQPGN